MINVMEVVLGQTSRENQHTAPSSEREIRTSSLDDTLEDLRLTMRNLERSAAIRGRFVVAVVYLFAALIIGLSLHVFFLGVP